MLFKGNKKENRILAQDFYKLIVRNTTVRFFVAHSMTELTYEQAKSMYVSLVVPVESSKLNVFVET